MIRHPGTRFAVAVVVAVLAACASSPDGDGSDGPNPEAQTRSDFDSLPPPGYGTLRQDAFTVALQADGVQVKLTPLAESVIRLAAPDTYQRLHGLVESRRERITQIGRNAGTRRDPLVFLVSFFSRARQSEFAPTDLELLSQGMLYRPLGIIPLTPSWGREQLKQEESQSALYIFEPSIDLDVPFELQLGGASTRRWESIISLLEAEHGRVLSRAKS